MTNYDNSLTVLQIKVGEWQREAFRDFKPQGQLKKLVKEAHELDIEFAARNYQADEKIRHEAADVAIVLLGFCEKMGFELLTAIREKMEINKARKWGAVLDDGTFQHLPENKT